MAQPRAAVNILCTGAEGQIARALRRRSGGEACVTALGRGEFDLARPERFSAVLDARRPDVVANIGAFTAVDQAEREEAAARAINAEGPAALAQECAARAIPIIHLSTDYVFDGAKPAPYVETDAIAPINAYGRTKALGEAGIAAVPQHVILRTAWVYAEEGKNFVRTMLRLARERERVGVVGDQIGNPTYAGDIADAVIAIARAIAENPGPEHWGIFHLAGAGETSWAGFASAIFEESAARGGPIAIVDPIASADYATPARRPANSRLDGSKLARVYALAAPPWRQSLQACMDIIAAGGWRVG